MNDNQWIYIQLSSDDDECCLVGAQIQGFATGLFYDRLSIAGFNVTMRRADLTELWSAT